MANQSEIQTKRMANGKIGELLGELELTARGWHVERLDGSSKAANGDLIALKGRSRVVLQVKTNGSQKNRAYLGHAGSFLTGNGSFFNGRGATIEADFVVSVTGGHLAARFFVFTVDEAEKLARKHSIEWHAVPTKAGRPRSSNFPVSPKIETLSGFENRWDKLAD